MKCPNCEGLLSGSAVACKTCGHRLTQASIEKWRTERGATNGQALAVKESPLAAKLRARFAEKPTVRQEANLLQFPVSPNASIHQASATAAAEPAWRSRVKASVQTHRERQTTDEVSTGQTNGTPPTAESDAAAQLLLIESALKRIRRAPEPPPAPVKARVTPTAISYPSAQSHALALMPQAERYAEAQRLAEEESPLNELLSELTPAPIATTAELPRPVFVPPAAEKLRALRTRHSTVTNLAFCIDEEPQTADFALDASPLTAEVLPELDIAQDEALAHAKTADRLRAKAAFFAQAQPAETEEEPVATPWHTDEEVAEIKGQVWLGKPAPIWLRTLAGICDIEAAAMLYLPFFGAYYTMDGALGSNDYYVMALMVVVVMFLYQLVTLALNGRTFGMAIFGLRNFDVEHANLRISFKRRLQQAFGGTVALLCPPFNFIVTRLTGFQRGFGDALAGTVTLRRAQE